MKLRHSYCGVPPRVGHFYVQSVTFTDRTTINGAELLHLFLRRQSAFPASARLPTNSISVNVKKTALDRVFHSGDNIRAAVVVIAALTHFRLSRSERWVGAEHPVGM